MPRVRLSGSQKFPPVSTTTSHIYVYVLLESQPTSVQFTLRWYICANKNSYIYIYMRSTPSLRCFPNVALETVPVYAWLTMVLSTINPYSPPHPNNNPPPPQANKTNNNNNNNKRYHTNDDLVIKSMGATETNEFHGKHLAIRDYLAGLHSTPLLRHQ